MESENPYNVLLAIVQAQDVDLAEQAFKESGVTSYQMPSVGGFLGRKNATLIIRVPKGKADEIIDMLSKTCQQRIEYIAVPLESAPLPLPTPTPISVGGATIFGINAEMMEEL